MSPQPQRSAAAKTRRIALQLERYLGRPVQKQPLPPPLDMLMATILSQNTNDKNSFRAYEELRKRFPRWDNVAAASLRSIKSAIRTGGMANQKAPRIKQTLAAVKKRYGRYSLSSLQQETDDNVMEQLTALRGVGFKTASCVLLFSLGRDVFPVDTHVHRICNRLGLVKGTSTPEKTYDRMKELLPRGKAYSFHTNLIRFGRMVCRSANPRCSVCPLFPDCLYEGKKLQARRDGSAGSRANHDFMLLDNVR